MAVQLHCIINPSLKLDTKIRHFLVISGGLQARDKNIDITTHSSHLSHLQSREMMRFWSSYLHEYTILTISIIGK